MCFQYKERIFKSYRILIINVSLGQIMWNIEKIIEIQPNFITMNQPRGLIYLVHTIPVGPTTGPSTQ